MSQASKTTVAGDWKRALEDQIEPELGREIDIFETQLELKRQGKIDDKVFAETRLRRGAYGQRYDNGKRHDGVTHRDLAFPTPLTKGPDTQWDAPGMMRIKIPYGLMTNEQLDVLADVAEEHADGILHVTTRQDIQLHFVHLDDTPTIMRRLGAVGITTREACGNSVRNVTGCPRAGVCGDEAFDTSPYADRLTYYFLGHPDIQDFGRKFKISFSGCGQHSCGLATIHDIGLIARTREVDGQVQRGFEFRVGGGLGAVPHQAQVFDEFVPEDELLPLCQAVFRVFARLGEKKNRSRARLKFLVSKLKLDEFKRLVLEERASLSDDEQWRLFDLERGTDTPVREASELPDGPKPDGFDAWFATNVSAQKQPGYSIATVKLPLGDLTGDQTRALANIARDLTGDTVRATVEQNVVLRWVSNGDLPELYERLAALGLAEAGASTVSDITACPGTDTCKLGIAASRGLAGELTVRLRKNKLDLPPDVGNLRIKTSGCHNSCGQHHVADIGLLGVSRAVKGRRVPHFQLVLGGQWSENAASYGLPIGAVPSKRVPQVLELVTRYYADNRDDGESIQAFFKRIGRAKVRALIQDLVAVPAYEDDPSFYSDWGDPREFTIGDLGVGECAGEVVTLADFGLADSEREVFEAQIKLDEDQPSAAAKQAYKAMLEAAKALVKLQNPDIGSDEQAIVSEFRTRFHDTKVFHDPFAGAKFAHYLFRTHEQPPNGVDAEGARQHIGEAQLFIEAAHACYARMNEGA